MSNKWPKVSVSEVCELIVDCVNKTAPTVDYLTPYRMIRTTNIRNGKIDLLNTKCVTEETYSKWTRRATVEPGDVLLTREAPLGEVGIIREKKSVFLGQRIMQYRVNSTLLNPYFLFYSFRFSDLQNQFNAHSGSGSVVDHIRVGDCLKFLISVPPLTEQNAIAHILGTLDDKIELNQKMNQTLEAMAQAIFKSWFVDFDPVRAKMAGQQPVGMDEATAALFPDSIEDSEIGEIPKGWKVKPLPEIIEVNPKRTLTKGKIAPYLDMKNMPTEGHRAATWIDREVGSGTKFINGDTLMARITPCLENGKTAYVDFLEDGQVGWGSTEYLIFRPKSPLPLEFGYYLARSEELRTFAMQNMTGSSGRQRTPANCFDNYLMPLPSEEIAHKFGEIVAPSMRMKKANSEQSQTLTALRDTLLPKLMSGELRVPEALIPDAL